MQKLSLILALALSAGLTACGGGSSDSGKTPTPTAASTPTPSPTSSPSPTPQPTPTFAPTTLVIEENSAAVVDFYPSSAYPGTSGSHTVLQGLKNDSSVTPAVSAYINFSVNVAHAGNFRLKVQYAFGGTETNLRDAWFYVNGEKVTVDDDEILEFDYTGVTDGKWNTFAYTDEVTVALVEGDNDIRLVAVNTEGYTRAITYTRNGSGGTQGATGVGVVTGLANIDSLEVNGFGDITEGSGSTVLYTLNVSVPDGGGSVTVSPEKEFYLPGTAVTLSANANAGMKLDSWTGDMPSTTSPLQFDVSKSVSIEARFIPSDATQPSSLSGFASIQSDDAVPYTLTGGYGASVTNVTSLAELETALSGSGPMILKISGLIDNSGSPSKSLNVPSNTTIFGDPSNIGHLKNIELKLAGNNYIIRNLKMSEVVAMAIKDGSGAVLVEEGQGNDVISINGGKHVWIDHCELHSSLVPAQLYDFTGPNDVADGVVDEYDAKDFYDGLIDIKNGATFITLSNNYIHDHWKAILIGSGDSEDNGDSNTRITLHHNYFKDINSRIPLLRFGKGHFYNNYVHGTLSSVYGSPLRIDSIMNVRMGADALIEKNYVEGTKYTFGCFYTSCTADSTGYWNLLDNQFVDVTNPVVTSTGDYTVPYLYSNSIESAVGLNSSVPAGAGTGVLLTSDLP